MENITSTQQPYIIDETRGYTFKVEKSSLADEELAALNYLTFGDYESGKVIELTGEVGELFLQQPLEGLIHD